MFFVFTFRLINVPDTMTNSNEDFNPVYTDPFPLEFLHGLSGLDWDDDEFRAGYPFSDIPEMESKGCMQPFKKSNKYRFVGR